MSSNVGDGPLGLEGTTDDLGGGGRGSFGIDDATGATEGDGDILLVGTISLCTSF